MWFSVVLAILLANTMVQGQPAVATCRGRCNLAFCFQNVQDAGTISVNSDLALELARECYSNANCECNFGTIFYEAGRAVRLNDDVCTLWPHDATLQNEVDCIRRIAGNQNQPQVAQVNELQTCLNHIYTDGNFLATDHSTECRYTVAVVSNGDIANENSVRTAARGLINKGATIHCYVIGNLQDQLSSVFRPQRNGGICTRLERYRTHAELMATVVRIYGDLACCDDPIPTTTAAPPRPLAGPCDNCKIINGVGYTDHPSRCDCWYRCEPIGNGQWVNRTQCCACGFFWDQRLLTCMPANNFGCPGDRDPCRGSSVFRWAYVGNCNGYWICDGSRTVSAECCPSGVGFNPTTQQCDPNQQCSDTCPCDEESTSHTCPFQANPLDANTYVVQEFPNSAPRIMRCPIGLRFDSLTCLCTIAEAVTRPECPADFNMPCSNNPLVDVANQVYIANLGVGVDPDNTMCSFNGNNANLLIPRYANYDWRDKFAIWARFHGGTNTNNGRPLVVNSDCGERSTVSLYLVSNFEVRAQILTRDGIFSITVPYRQNQWNSAFMYYDGDKLVLCIKYADGSTETRENTNAEGLVQRCLCALQVGKSDEPNQPSMYYGGDISQVRVFINCVPADGCNL